ncbi:MAG: hypothetical protein HGB26_05900 [Desulfobulbaceae bacterium]|nr:hypothetical protein [Desulfobulbaceae bacterium]
MQPFQRSIIPIGLSSFILLVSVIPGITAVINLHHTGQVTCYNSAGTAIDCAGTGQDGDVRAGVPWPIPRFVDNLINSA